jgi:methyl-accepting chemotaxis protein
MMSTNLNRAEAPAATDDLDRETRLRFMRIDTKSGALLQEFWPVIETALADILEGFYRHVMTQPELARTLGNDVPRLKAAQRSHWAKLFSGQFDPTYMQAVRTIGLTHNKIGLEPRWYIGGYNFVLGELTKLAVQHHRWGRARLPALLTALNAAVMLDMDLAISVYQEAMLLERHQRQEKMANALQDFDRHLRETIATLSEAASNMQNTANTLAANAEETARQSTAVAAASEEAATNAQTVASATEELSASVGEISRQVTQSTSIASEAVVQAERTNTSVQGLTEAANRIGDVVKLIQDIASQTNLLALNATIEAARAGEAGKGFAVVAAEVKSLANQTASATGEISQHVLAIQEATRESAIAIQEIAKTITSVNEIATVVAGAVEEQRATTTEIARNIQDASNSTQEVSRNIIGVTEAASSTGDIATQVLSAASALNGQAEGLRNQVDQFFTEIQAA